MTALAHHIEWLLIFGILPAWLLAGAADWLCHRRSDIEHTSGARESAYHLLLFLEIAIPVLAITFLHVTTPILLLLAAGVLAHFVTSWIDTRYAQSRRHIAPVEQLVHSFLEMLPLFGLVLLVLLNTDAVTAPDWRIVPREAIPQGAWLVAAGLLGGFAFIVEEGLRGLRRAPAA